MIKTKTQEIAPAITHPAVSAWLELSVAGDIPDLISTLKKKEGSNAIYRLEFKSASRSAIIAKYCPEETASLERKIYETVLPAVPVSKFCYYGSVPDKGRAWRWLFMEDVGNQAFNVDNPEHRDLAAKWLGVFHAFTSNGEHHQWLPERGSDFYETLLCKARQAIQANLSSRSLPARQVGILWDGLDALDCLKSEWGVIEEFCEFMPSCIFHGDFVSKNVTVRVQDGMSQLFPYDWESVGYGVPAQDVREVNLQTYLLEVRNTWPVLNTSAIWKLECLGRIYWTLRLMHWASEKLRDQWVDSVILNEIQFYNQKLRMAFKQFTRQSSG